MMSPSKLVTVLPLPALTSTELEITTVFRLTPCSNIFLYSYSNSTYGYRARPDEVTTKDQAAMICAIREANYQMTSYTRLRQFELLIVSCK